jgi:acetyl-CoA synthase
MSRLLPTLPPSSWASPSCATRELAEEIPDWYISHPDYDTLVNYALEVRGIKLKIVNIPVPITIGPAFEGETIRKGDMYVEFGGGRTQAFELVQMVGKMRSKTARSKSSGRKSMTSKKEAGCPWASKVKIYGRKMQKDFEGVLERRIHYFVNYGEGLWHVAQRDLCWLRISKDAV